MSLLWDIATIAAIVAVALGCDWVAKALVRSEDRARERDETNKRHRPSDPQAGLSVAEGTGVERARPHRADASALPRSPHTPVDAVDPRPTASTGPMTPVGAAVQLLPPAASAGLHRRRVVLHG